MCDKIHDGTRTRFEAPVPPIRFQADGLFENLSMMGLKTEVRFLDVEVGSSLLRITQIVSADRYHCVEYITALFRPTPYQHRMMLSRVQTGNRDPWSSAGLDASPRRTVPQRRASYREKSG